MKDRIVQYPNRFKLTQVSGDIYDLTPEPGIVTEEGDDLNKANLLPDDVAAAFGLTGNPQVKDVLAKLSSAVSPLQYVWDKYSQTENLATLKSTLLTRSTGSTTTFAIQYSDSFVYLGNGTYQLVNPQSINLSYANYATYKDVLKNKYWSGTGNPLCKSPSDAVITQKYVYPEYELYIPAQAVTVSETFVEQVASYAANAYPQNGVIENERYSFRGRPQYFDTRIAAGTYTGTGTFGPNNKNSLTFPFNPEVLFIMTTATSAPSGLEGWLAMFTPGNYTWLGNVNSGSVIMNVDNNLKGAWGDTVQWWADNGSLSSSKTQMNVSGVVYKYVAIG